jgi:hypothetical protein
MSDDERRQAGIAEGDVFSGFEPANRQRITNQGAADFIRSAAGSYQRVENVATPFFLQYFAKKPKISRYIPPKLRLSWITLSLRLPPPAECWGMR